MYAFNVSSGNSPQQPPLGVTQALSLPSAPGLKHRRVKATHMGPSANKTELHEQRANCWIDKYRTFLSTIVILSNSFLLKYPCM